MLQTTLIIGLIGALLMFAGDMALYYSRDDFEHSGSLDPIITIMKDLPKKRVMIGGWIGPIAAFLYCIGFYHIVLITEEPSFPLAFAAFLLSCFGIIAGGAYHSHCACLGLLGQQDQRKDLDIVLHYFQKLPLLLYIGEGIGLLFLFYLILSGKTILPAWLALLSPGVLFLLRPLMRKLPKGIHMVVAGGFTNLIFIVCCLAVLLAAR